jgi:hypothetical protein
MTKLYNTPIEVVTENGLPSRFQWRKRWRTIRAVNERSQLRADWWHTEINRAHYSVECDDLELFEIYRQGDRWFLERIWD